MIKGEESMSGWVWGSLVIYSCANILAGTVMTVSVSEICLGNRPSVLRSYKRVFDTFPGKLLATNLLASLIILIGFILLIVPGLIFLPWLLFVGPVTILERTFGIKAFKRSKTLGEGYHTRNCVVAVMLIIIELLLDQLLNSLGDRIAGIFHFVDPLVIKVCLVPLSELFSPILLIIIILMYYDLRVRKEFYNNAALAEDLKH